MSFISAANVVPVLYQPYPTNWPEFTPRDKVADWLETYATIQDLVVWTSTELNQRPSYDPASQTWTVTVYRNGKPVTLHPAHIILATGTLGSKNKPTFRDNDLFSGDVYHSSEYPGSAALAGKRVVVIGAGQSASDLCQDLALNGVAAVTMVQRSFSCVMLREYVNAQVKRAFPEDVPMDVVDLRYTSHPLGLTRQKEIENQAAAEAANAELHAKLRKGGAHVNLGPEGQGVYPLFYERFGGEHRVFV